MNWQHFVSAFGRPWERHFLPRNFFGGILGDGLAASSKREMKRPSAISMNVIPYIQAQAKSEGPGTSFEIFVSIHVYPNVYHCSSK